MRVRGEYITGYMTTEEQRWIAGEKTTDFLRAIVFRQHTGQGDILPPWPDDDHAFNALIASAHVVLAEIKKDGSNKRCDS